MIFIKVLIKGMHVKHNYDVNSKIEEITVDGEEKNVYCGIPQLIRNDEYEYETMYELEDCAQLFMTSGWGQIYDGDKKENQLTITNRRIRVDLGVVEVLTTKVISEEDVNKTESEMLLLAHMAAFNEDMICSNEHLKKYCDIHKLNPKETDVLKLWDIVYPENDYNIMNGEMVKVPNPGTDNLDNRSYYISANDITRLSCDVRNSCISTTTTVNTNGKYF